MLLLAVSRRPWQPVAIVMDLSSLVEGNDDGDAGVEVWGWEFVFMEVNRRRECVCVCQPQTPCWAPVFAL